MSRLRHHLWLAVVAQVGAIAITIITWVQLRSFDQSLRIGAPGPAIARAIEIVVGVAALVVPAYGTRALVRSLRSRRLGA